MFGTRLTAVSLVGLVALVMLAPATAASRQPRPALMVGSPWGRSDASCPDRPNPPVPMWHARATWRFQVGLADDMIGYLLPPWGFATQPGVYLTTCTTDSNDRDQRGHQHKLEDESVGPTAGGLVAQHLTALLAADPLGAGPASIEPGRYVLSDGSLSRSAVGAVGVRLADGTTHQGTFVDYDGATQPAPDLATRGLTAGGRTIFVDVYPDGVQ